MSRKNTKSRESIRDKDKFDCEDCNKDVVQEDKALICRVCEKWYHIKCQRISVAEYEFLQKSDDSIQWFCKSCKGASQKMFKMLTLVHKRQDQIETEVKTLNNGMKECNSKIDSQSKAVHEIVQDVSDIKMHMPTMISEKVGEFLQDKHEEEIREKNLVFFNVKEQETDNPKESDIATVVDGICGDVLNVTAVELKDITRLGRFNPGAANMRPLRVTIESRAVRGGILKNAHKLRNSVNFKKVGISRDLTKKQREINKGLRKELQTVQKRFPDRNWGIRRDKIVELPRTGDPPQHRTGDPPQTGAGDGRA